MKMKAFFAAVLLALTCAVAPPAAAQEESGMKAERVAVRAAPAPTREGLIAFWEQATRADPHVQKLEKAKEEGVYLFETGFFPYKGRLKLLNAVVTGDDSQYYENLSRGIVEVELMDAGDDFFKKYGRSYGAWTQGLNFYYNGKKGVWFAPKDWNAHARDLGPAAAAADDAVTVSGRGCPYTSLFARHGGSLIYLGVFLGVVFLLLLFARKQNKRIWDNHAKALEEQQRGLKMAGESLKHQQEQTRLLQEILSALKK